MCSGRVATPSTSLLASEPDIAAEWHDERNGDLTAADVRPGSNKKVWWRCSEDATHEWQSTVVNRTKGSGCPFCRLVPRSREEIILACELLSFLSFDLDEHKLLVGGKLVDVDILIPELHLVVEFDGCYWHREKARIDADKSALLTHAGWRVIRVREEPLEKIGPNDVVVPQKAPKAGANIVLLKIQDVCRVELPGIRTYLESKSLVNVEKANSVIKALLAERSKGQEDVYDGQGLLFALDDEDGRESDGKHT
jgi:hypothetical protein